MSERNYQQPPSDPPDKHGKVASRHNNEEPHEPSDSTVEESSPETLPPTSSDETSQKQDDYQEIGQAPDVENYSKSLRKHKQSSKGMDKNTSKKRKKSSKRSKRKNEPPIESTDAPTQDNRIDEGKENIFKNSKGNRLPLSTSATKVNSCRSENTVESSKDVIDDKLKKPPDPSTTEAQAPVEPTLQISVVKEPVRRKARGNIYGNETMIKPSRTSERKPPEPLMPPISTPPPSQPATQPPDPPLEPDKSTSTEVPVETETPYVPREKTAINICKREQWRARATKFSKDLDAEENYIKLPAIGVVFVTNTEVDECKTLDHCAHEMRRIQNHHMDDLGLKDIAYNWVMGGDLTMFEGLGWDRRSPVAMNKQFDIMVGHNIYIGFLGQYTAENIPLDTLNHALAFIYLNMPENKIKEDYKSYVYEKLQIIDQEKFDFVHDLFL